MKQIAEYTRIFSKRPGGRPSRMHPARADSIEHFSKQHLDLPRRQAFADKMTIDPEPKQTAGTARSLGLDHDSLEH
jgi:hypothetical protein